MKITKSRCKINAILLTSLVFSIIVIVLLCIFGIRNIIAFLKCFDYTALAAIVSIIALIVTIVINSKNQSKSIEATIRSNNQLEFEKGLYNILDIYNQLVLDMSLLKIDIDSYQNDLIQKECIYSWNDCTTKYIFLLDDIEHRIYYLYKYYNSFEHNELDKLIKDIKGLNQSLKLKLIDYSNLSVRASKVNGEYAKINNNSVQGNLNSTIDDIFNDIQEIINDQKNIINIISNLILNNKNMIYTEALNCIKEREELIKLYNMK